MDNVLKRLDAMDARASEANPECSWRWERRYAEDLPAATKLLRALLAERAVCLAGNRSLSEYDAACREGDAALAEFGKGDA